MSLSPSQLTVLPAPLQTLEGPERKRSVFPNALSQFVYTRTYPRWKEDEGRRERYEESVSRYVGFLREEREVPEDVLNDIKIGMLDMGVLPSMRAFWSAGEGARRDNTMFYNCSFIPLDSLPSFSELLYILMMGTGVGYSVESRFVNNLPVVAYQNGKVVRYQIPDSTEGWQDSLLDCLKYLFQGFDVDFDYSLIRLAGARCKTKGGRASGPDPLRNLLDFVRKTLKGAQGRKLTDEEVSDIACMIGEIVMAGGVRRSALICFCDPESDLMRHYKKFPTCKECGFSWATHLSRHADTGEADHAESHLRKEHGMTEAEYLAKHGKDSYLGFPALRFMANISSFWSGKPSEEEFWVEWTALRNSGSGERGFYTVPPKKRAERRGELRSNPCGEILLRFAESTDPWTGEGGGGQFCNLSAAVMRSHDTRATFARKIRTATWIGVIQSTFTYFPRLRPAWKQHCDEDRLIGVDITGHCDNPALSNDPEAMLYFNQVARETAAEAAAHFGIPVPASITCGKPSGNSSQLVDCASGFHTRYAPFYLRRVRVASTDPLLQLIRDEGVPVHKDNKYQNTPDAECPTWVAEFPVKSPEGAITRSDETALGQLNRYLHIMRTYIGDRGHNQSATVYVRDEEWDAVGEWLYYHWEEVTGLSFLPYSGGKYRLAPYEEITEDEYNRLMETFPSIDWDALQYYETEDMGTGAKELACVGGACEIDFSKDEMEQFGKEEEAEKKPSFDSIPFCASQGSCTFDCNQCLGRDD